MKWYAIRTAPQRELRAERVLREAGFVTFCPTTQKAARSHSGLRRVWTAAMMPSYLFCAEVVPWALIRSAQRHGRRLMLGVLEADGMPSPIPDEALAVLRKIDGTSEDVRQIKPGDVVRIRIGRHDVREVTITAVDHGWLQVAMMMLGSWRRVYVERSQVEAA